MKYIHIFSCPQALSLKKQNSLLLPNPRGFEEIPNFLTKLQHCEFNYYFLIKRGVHLPS